MTISCGSVAVVAIGTISVTTNNASATFTVTDPSTYASPVTYSGSGTSWSQANAPIGTYSITFGAIANYNTPTDTPKTFSSGGTASFAGTYTLSTGSVTFTSNPSGADIYLDTTPSPTTHQTPLTGGVDIVGLTPGLWYYKLHKDGYLDITGSLTINPGSNSSANTFAGSAHITSTPTGAEVYLAPSPSTATDQGHTTDRTFTGMTDASSDATTTWNYKLTKAGYTDNTGSFLATAGQTVEVPKTLLTVMHIVATGITVIPSNPCIEGTCSVTVTITWINMGETGGLHDLSLTVGGGTSTIIPSAYTSVSFDANGTEGDTVTRIFTVTGLDNAHSPHSICPNPNT